MESALAILDKIFGKREEIEIIHFSQRGKVASCGERVHKGNYLRCLANVTCDKCLDAVERIANERDWYDIPPNKHREKKRVAEEKINEVSHE